MEGKAMLHTEKPTRLAVALLLAAAAAGGAQTPPRQAGPPPLNYADVNLDTRFGTLVRRWNAGIGPWLSPAAPQVTPVSPEWAARWRSDVKLACREMPTRHVNLFHTLDRDDFDLACRRLIDDVPRLAAHEIVVRLAEIVASVGDGHSRLTIPTAPEARLLTSHTAAEPPRIPVFRHLPVRLERLSDGYVVTRVAGGLDRLLGARLAAIDGQSVAAIEQAIAPVVNRDNEHQLHDLLPFFFVVPEVLAARGVARDMEQTVWTFVRTDGSTEAVPLAPLASGAVTAWRTFDELVTPPRHRQRPDRTFWFEMLGDRRTLYVRIAQIADEETETLERFSDRVFAEAASTGASRLVVDLRGNTGGNNGLNAPLVRGLVRAERFWEPGALFVIVDGGTFSAAMNLATEIEKLTPAIFVGSGTGARPNSYGDARRFVLPESGLALRLSSLYWQDGGPMDNRLAIEPLMAAEPTLADYRSGRDVALDRILALDAPIASIAGAWRGEMAVGRRRAAVTITIAGDEARTATLSVPSLGVEGAAIVDLAREGAVARGVARLQTRDAPIALRFAGRSAAGWLSYEGRLYPFALSSAASAP